MRIDRDLYNCKARLSYQEGSNRNIILTSGDHFPGRTNANVESIIVFGQTTHFVPQNLGQIFPNLLSINGQVQL
jgi:hypothetical protein